MTGFTIVTITSGSGDSVKLALESLWANQQILRNLHIDSAAPDTIVEGMLWVNNTSSTQYIVNLRQNGAWVVLTDKIAEGNRDFAGFQALNFLMEKLASGSLVSTEARLQWDETLKTMAFGDGTLQRLVHAWDDAFNELIEVADATFNVNGLGTPATLDTTTLPAVPGYKMDAAAEQLNAVFVPRWPAGWPGGTDGFMDVHWYPVAAETAADDPKFDGDIRICTPGVDALDKASSALAASTGVIAATAAKTLHRSRLTIDHNLAGQLLAAADSLNVVLGRVAVGGAGEVAGLVVFGMTLMVPAIGSQTE